MTPERWQQVDKLLEQALEHEPARRGAFLDVACQGDAALRREVESLLSAHGKAEGFTEAGPMRKPVKTSVEESQLLTGRQVGHYQILSRLGEGGMGVVYKARDTHLDRFVAIKVLPHELVADPDRKRRFVQEAKAASALKHPNIITIHDIASDNGTDFIVMEYVEGKTLGELIPRRGMKLNAVLKVAIQIADGLAKAHAVGIIHRDLKPGNIMVGEGGLVKVLDFGLAKLTERRELMEDEATVTKPPWTDEGTILGTASYMSPEQAAGKPVDARSDIFSFGSVLYEMVTGQRAFQGDSKMSTLAAVLNQEPKPATEIVRALTHDLEKIITRCLRKDPERRFQHMADLKVALEELKEESDSGLLGVKGADSSGKPMRFSLLRWVTLAAAGISLAVAAWFWLGRSGTAQPEGALSVVPLTTYPGLEYSPTFSPDGKQIAFQWNGEKQDNFDIYVKIIGSETQLQLTRNPAEDTSPAWSPDGRWIAFLRVLPGRRAAVILISPLGGQERKLAEVNLPWAPWFSLQPEWSNDSKSIIVADTGSPAGALSLSSIALDSAEKRRLTVPPSFHDDSAPALSPDGRTLVFSRSHGFPSSELFLLSLSKGLIATDEPRRLTSVGSSAPWAGWISDGREVIFSSGYLDHRYLWKVAISGDRKPQRLGIGEVGNNVAVSRQGDRLAYTREISDPNIWRVGVLAGDRKDGQPERLISSTYLESNPGYSPDGRKIVFSSTRTGREEIWICDSDGSNPWQLTTTAAGGSGGPRWSPDGEQVAFDSNQDGENAIYVVRIDSRKPRRLTHHASLGFHPSWSRDSQWIYFRSDRSGSSEIWKIPAGGGEPSQVTRHGGYVAFESHDGRTLYYTKQYDRSPLFSRPVGGGEETQLVDSVFRRAFTVTPHGIFFIASPDAKGFSIRFLDFATLSVKRIVSIESPWLNGLSVSPDERWILYPKLDHKESDLMLVENFR